MQLQAWLKQNWPRLRHIAFVGLEVAGGIVLVLAVATGLLLWRLSAGDLSVAFLSAPIERAVNAELSNYSVSIGDTVIERSDSGAGISLRLKDIALRDTSGQIVAEAPKAAIGVDAGELITGSIVANRFDLLGAKLAVTYGADGRLRVSVDSGPLTAAVSEDTADEAEPERDANAAIERFKQVLDHSGESGSFGSLQEVGIADTDAVFLHERLGLRWRIRHGNVKISRVDGGMRIHFAVRVGEDGAAVPITGQIDVRDRDGTIHVTGRIDDFVPRALTKDVETLSLVALADMPVSGRFAFHIQEDGKLRDVSLLADLKAGYIRLPGEKHADGGILVDEASLKVRYDPQTNVVTIDPSRFFIGRTQGTVRGVLGPADLDGPDAGRWTYALAASEVTLAVAEENEQPLSVDSIILNGRFSPEEDSVWLDRGELIAGEAGIAAAGRISAGKVSPEVRLAASLSPIPIRSFLRLWPDRLATGVRAWIAENIKDGRFTDATIRVDLADGLIKEIEAGGSIPPGAVLIDFGVDAVVASYLKPLPLIWDGRGRGKLAGGQFEMSIETAHVLLPSGEQLDIPVGKISVENISLPLPEGVVEARILGKVPAILEMLDHEPLGYVSEVGMSAGEFSGEGQVDLRLTLPFLDEVRFEQVSIRADAELRELAAKKAFAGRDASSGVVLIRVDNAGLEAAGEVLIDNERANVMWSLPFGKEKPGKPKLSVRMRLDDAGRKKLGIDLPFVSGPVDVTFTPQHQEAGKNKKKGASITLVSADIRHSSLSLPDIAWEKLAGEPGTVDFALRETAEGEMILEDFALVTNSARISGKMRLDGKGAVRSADFPEFQLSRLDRLSLTASRGQEGRLNVSVGGDQFDGRNFFKSLFSTLGANEKTKSLAGADTMMLKADIGKVIGNNATDVHDVSVRMQMRNSRTETMELSGQINGRIPVSGRISAGVDGADRVMVVNADNAGAVLRLVDLYRRAYGGSLNLAANLPASRQGETRGTLRISNFQIRNEPILGQIAAAAPARPSGAGDGGNAESISGSGVSFNLLRLPFRRSPGKLVLGDSIIRGAAVGATLRGEVDFLSNQVNLSGTYIPAYALNNLLNRVPIVGLFMGGEEEGLLGITYAIRGSPEQPSVTINPMSAMAPGIFRKIFDFSATGSLSRGAKQNEPGSGGPVQNEPGFSGGARSQPGRQSQPQRRP